MPPCSTRLSCFHPPLRVRAMLLASCPLGVQLLHDFLGDRWPLPDGNIGQDRHQRDASDHICGDDLAVEGLAIVAEELDFAGSLVIPPSFPTPRTSIQGNQLAESQASPSLPGR